MAKPVEALQAVRGLLTEGGVALVADELRTSSRRPATTSSG